VRPIKLPRVILARLFHQLGPSSDPVAKDSLHCGARSLLLLLGSKPFAARFFVLRLHVADSVVIVPVVPHLTSASAYVPAIISHINCFQLSDADTELERLVTILLENFQLLRPERRLFISYRRVEAQSVAIQLYEKLDAAGFDVFLDTRGTPPAVDFQSVLWHRLADSDVVVLLDTPRFRESRWTREERARANSTNIQKTVRTAASFLTTPRSRRRTPRSRGQPDRDHMQRDVKRVGCNC